MELGTGIGYLEVKLSFEDKRKLGGGLGGRFCAFEYGFCEFGSGFCGFENGFWGFENESCENGAVELGCGSINRILHVELDRCVELADEDMDRVLSGSPNLEDMNLESVSGISHLEISSEKLRELCEIRIRKRNVASFVNAMIHVEFEFEESYLKELLHSIAHVENHN
ncbi:hypothetical protein T459_24926 [Capsicum annuum]|uniref:Uncharacterized protein n=1 Tax=Capsicum annuum TaxID=4072 RepID=A0A2G2YJ88_CAPAN|nr:hypothetical protein T459_24926 [Capsicum annuum]